MGPLNSAKTAWRLLRVDRSRLWSMLRWHYYPWMVFSARPADIPAPRPLPGLVVRLLSEEEVRALAPTNHEVAEGLDRLDAIAGESVWGAFLDGRFAHLSWVVGSAQDHKRNGPRLVKLGPREIEITHCVTLPEFRGRGIYPEVIRTLSASAAGDGVREIFMITDASNIASQRGILNAGLRRRAGGIHWVRVLSISATLRTFRWRSPTPVS